MCFCVLGPFSFVALAADFISLETRSSTRVRSADFNSCALISGLRCGDVSRGSLNVAGSAKKSLSPMRALIVRSLNGRYLYRIFGTRRSLICSPQIQSAQFHALLGACLSFVGLSCSMSFPGSARFRQGVCEPARNNFPQIQSQWPAVRAAPLRRQYRQSQIYGRARYRRVARKTAPKEQSRRRLFRVSALLPGYSHSYMSLIGSRGIGRLLSSNNESQNAKATISPLCHEHGDRRQPSLRGAGVPMNFARLVWKFAMERSMYGFGFAPVNPADFMPCWTASIFEKSCEST